jgi:hypothetical protein
MENGENEGIIQRMRDHGEAKEATKEARFQAELNELTKEFLERDGAGKPMPEKEIRKREAKAYRLLSPRQKWKAFREARKTSTHIG